MDTTATGGSRQILIPRVFHRIWLGGPEPDQFKAWGRTWLDHHPGWELKTWTEGTLPPSRYPDMLRRCVSLSQKANIIRYELLLDHGGVYIDADFECKKNLEPLIEGATAFAARVEDDPHDIFALNNAIMGGTKGHPFLKSLVDGISLTHPEVLCSMGPPFITALAKRHPTVRVLERRSVYPYKWNELHRRGEPFREAYAVHHWSSQWLKTAFQQERDGSPSPESRFDVDRVEYAMAVAETVTGWMGQTELRWLAEQAMARRAIVEFGSFHGRSAKAMTLATPGTVWAIDKWDWTSHLHPCVPIWDSFQRYHFGEIKAGKVVPLRGNTATGARVLLKKGVRADMVFIDADHSYESAKQDIELGIQLLGGRGSGGLLCGHDFNPVGFPGVVRAVMELVPNYELPTEGSGWIWAARI